jgi:hypothetical protein
MGGKVVLLLASFCENSHGRNLKLKINIFENPKKKARR